MKLNTFVHALRSTLHEDTGQWVQMLVSEVPTADGLHAIITSSAR